MSRSLSKGQSYRLGKWLEANQEELASKRLTRIEIAAAAERALTVPISPSSVSLIISDIPLPALRGVRGERSHKSRAAELLARAILELADEIGVTLSHRDSIAAIAAHDPMTQEKQSD